MAEESYVDPDYVDLDYVDDEPPSSSSLPAGFLRDPYDRVVYLAEFSDQVLEANVITDRASSDRSVFWVSGNLYPPMIEHVADIEWSLIPLFRNDSPIGGGMIPRLGTMRISNIEGTETDVWRGDTTRYRSYDGVPFEIKLGGISDNIQDYRTVLTGQTASVSGDIDGIDIVLADKSQRLRIPVQVNEYAGTGEYEGPAELAGRPKPLAFGECPNVLPVTINHTLGVYQFHDGPAQAVPQVYVQGGPLTPLGDISSPDLSGVSSLFNWNPGSHPGGAAGGYITDLARGCFRLAAPPNGLVTADVVGDQNVSDPHAGAIGLSLIRRRLSDSEIDISSFDWVPLGNRNPLRYYLDGGSRINLDTALNQVMSSIGAFWSFDIQQRIYARRIVFDTSTTVITDDDIVLRNGIKYEHITQPPYRLRVGYDRNWHVQAQRDLIGAVDEAHAAFVQEQYRYFTLTTFDFETRYPTAGEQTWDFLQVNRTQAVTEASRQREILNRSIGLIRLTLFGRQFELTIGDTVDINSNHFRTLQGNVPTVHGIVAYIRENTRDGTTDVAIYR